MTNPLIYERVDGTVYVREFGADPGTRREVGWNYDPRTHDGRPLKNTLQNKQLMHEICQAAETNSALKDALERAIMIYQLSKKT